ncbi:hypothetical protein [Nocardioides bruguierae]|uniref:hypothetical protein n=1 Tax=Nocardioides bruguierae TaxID=2945102 RepID=UPI0020211F6F|nr:hypothetical protein [Nocardioides bruguierae]MCL8024433.1 hypothetical protein [Nocardioides bruguierae]
MSTTDTPRREHGVLAPFRSLLTAQLVGTGLGLLFWVVVARVVPADSVGTASGAINTQTLLGSLVSLGLGTLLIAELPRLVPGRQRALLLRGVLVAATVGAGLALAVGLAARAGLLGPTLRAALEPVAGLVVFVVGVAAAACGVVVDESSLGLGRSSVQVWRNLLAAGSRFPVAAVLVLAGVRDQLVLQVCWVAPIVLSVAVVLWRVLPRERAGSGPGLLADLRGYAAAAAHHQVLSVAVAAATQLVPVVAAVVLLPRDNAAFAIAWLAAGFAFLPPYLLAVALFAHGADAGEAALRRSIGTTLPAGLLLSACLVAGAWLLGRPVMSLFGPTYAEESAHLLALLVPAGLWMVVKDHLVALLRTQERFTLASRLAVVALVLELTGAVIGGLLHGADGVALGWIAAMVLEAVLAAPLVRRTLGGSPWVAPSPRRLLAARAGGGGTSGEAQAERGAVSLRTTTILLGVLTLVLLLVVVGIGVRSVRAPSDDVADGGTGTAGTTLSTCTPTAAQPGPLLDLGVQAATGDAADPVLDPEQVDALVAAAADAGADVVSTAVAWQAVEPSRGVRRWAAVDEVVDSALAAGLEVRVVLTGSPSWAVGDGTLSDAEARWRAPTTPAELRRWRSFVAAAAEHLSGRATYVEVWSEPDTPEFWTTGPSPRAYARLLTQTSQVLRRVAPDLTIISGGLGGNDIGFLRRVYRALGPGERPFDLVGVHPWPGDDAPAAVDASAPLTGTFGAYDDTFAGYRDVWRVLVAHGDDDLGLYVGEFGYSTSDHGDVRGTDDATRAGYVAQALGIATCTPYVVGLSWYYLHPTPWNPASWTLLDDQGTTNRTYAALRTWTQRRQELVDETATDSGTGTGDES